MSAPTCYRLIRTIASGGMAQVYEALLSGYKGFERRVVIKRILPEYAQQNELQQMFFDEARIASQLHHGNIVQILDYGSIEGSEFLVMEYVDGLDVARTLVRSRSRESGMPSSVALHIVAEVAHALAYVHARQRPDGDALGIIHRDISPENILLSWDGDVKLSDFGIALARERVARTQTGVVKGKWAYMSPEQARGDALTPASDCFSLGMTFEAMLLEETLALPFSARGSETHRNALESAGIDAECAALVVELTHPQASLRLDAEQTALRAGELAAKRLQRSGRSALQGWLKPLREQVAKVNPLDDLLGLYLVAGEEGRGYSVQREGREGGALGLALTAGEQANQAEVFGDLALPQKRSPRRPKPIVAFLSIGAIASSLLIFYFTQASPRLGGEQKRDPYRAKRDASADTVSVKAEKPLPLKPDASAPPRDPLQRSNTQVPSIPEGDGLAREPQQTDASAPRKSSRAMRKHRRASVNEGKSAWLRIGGRRFAGCEVLIDGRTIGFAPLERMLKVGTHQVVILSGEDRSVVFRTLLRLEAKHTQTEPLKVFQ